MTADDLEQKIDAAYDRELRAIADGTACTTPDGKPASTMKERMEMLKAAGEHLDRKRPPVTQSGPEWGKALNGKQEAARG